MEKIDRHSLVILGIGTIIGVFLGLGLSLWLHADKSSEQTAMLQKNSAAIEQMKEQASKEEKFLTWG